MLDVFTVALRVSALLSTAAAFWMYFDGLELLPDLEAALWAVAMLLSSSATLIFGSLTALAVPLLVGSLYVARTRGGVKRN